MISSGNTYPSFECKIEVYEKLLNFFKPLNSKLDQRQVEFNKIFKKNWPKCVQKRDNLITNLHSLGLNYSDAANTASSLSRGDLKHEKSIGIVYYFLVTLPSIGNEILVTYNCDSKSTCEEITKAMKPHWGDATPLSEEKIAQKKEGKLKSRLEGARGRKSDVPKAEDCGHITIDDDDDHFWELICDQEEPHTFDKFFEFHAKNILDNFGKRSKTRITFSPYITIHEVGEFQYGFKEVQIYTSINSWESDNVDIQFNDSYLAGVNLPSAMIVKCGSPHQGHWKIVSNDIKPLDGNYEFVGDALTIYPEKKDYLFQVRFQVGRYSSSICNKDGSEISKKNKRTILKMLVGDKIFKENNGLFSSPGLITKKYRLREIPR